MYGGTQFYWEFLYLTFTGQRPFGVSFLFAGWDRHFGFQLYHSDPSGNFGGWKATAIGKNNQVAKHFGLKLVYTLTIKGAMSMLKTEYDPAAPPTCDDALKLAVKVRSCRHVCDLKIIQVLSKTLDSASPSAEKMEFCVFKRRCSHAFENCIPYCVRVS
jgi:20S proteasome subunit alpha 3